MIPTHTPTRKKFAQGIQNNIICSQKQKQFSFSNSKQHFFNRNNLPYSHPISIQPPNQKHMQLPNKQPHPQKLTIPNPQIQLKDSLTINYMQKMLQLFLKNAELQLNIKQSRNDTNNLQYQVSELTELIKQIFLLIQDKEISDQSQQSHLTNLSTLLYQHLESNHTSSQSSHSSYIASLTRIKKLINNLDKVKQQSSISQNTHTISAPITLTPPKKQNKQDLPPSQKINIAKDKSSRNKLPYTHKHSNSQVTIKNILQNNINTSDQHHLPNIIPEHYQQNYNDIIIQYKTIIQTLHRNLLKKQKNNQFLKQQLKKYQHIFQQYSHKANAYQQQISNKTNQINQLTNNYSSLKQQYEKYKQYEFKDIKQKYQQLLTLSKQKDHSIQGLVYENEQLFKQKQKNKQIYQKQLSNFQNMQKIVQQKLIQIEHQMNFYKQQRICHLDQILLLQSQLKQYKSNQKQKYYSFGDAHKDVQIQVNQSQLQHHSYPKQTAKNHTKNTHSDNPPLKRSKPQPLPPSHQPHQNQHYPIQCYQQSINQLLDQNDRLKQILIKLYTKQKQLGNLPSIFNKQIQSQLKIMFNTANNKPKCLASTHSIHHLDQSLYQS